MRWRPGKKGTRANLLLQAGAEVVQLAGAAEELAVLAQQDVELRWRLYQRLAPLTSTAAATFVPHRAIATLLELDSPGAHVRAFEPALRAPRPRAGRPRRRGRAHGLQALVSASLAPPLSCTTPAFISPSTSSSAPNSASLASRLATGFKSSRIWRGF